MGNCIKKDKTLPNSKSNKIRNSIHSTDSQQTFSTGLSNSQILCLKLIYRDLARRSKTKYLNTRNFRAFFHLNFDLGEHLFYMHGERGDNGMTEMSFMQIFNQAYNNRKQQKQNVSKLIFSLLDVDGNGELSYFQFMAMFTSNFQVAVRVIVRDDRFLCTLGVKQIYDFLRNGVVCYQNSSSSKEGINSDLIIEVKRSSKSIIQIPTTEKQLLKCNKQDIIKLLKQKVINNSINCPSLIPKYVTYLFHSLRLNTQTDKITSKQFQSLVKQNPSLLSCFCTGFHEYLWKYESGFPLYKTVFPGISDFCTEKVGDSERPVYVALINEVLMVFQCEKMKEPIQMKILEGLHVRPTSGTFGYGITVFGEKGVYPQTSYFFQNLQKQKEWLQMTKQYRLKSFQKKYKLQQKLASGRCSQIYKCQQLSTSQTYSVKILKKSQLKIHSINPYIQFQFLSLCSQQNVLQIHQILETKNNIYIVMEFLGNNRVTLGEFVRDWSSGVKEMEVKKIMKEVFGAVAKINDLGVVCENLEPNKIFIKRENDRNTPKIIDFSSAMFLACTTPPILPPGTDQNFIAPQITHNNSYTAKIDSYSLGAILLSILCGQVPSSGTITSEKVMNFEGYGWQKCSHRAKDLIRKLLCPREMRLTCGEALRHQWFQ